VPYTQVPASFYINATAPVYVLAGNGGAGFSDNFLKAPFTPGSSTYTGVNASYILNFNEDINGYLSFIAGPTSLAMEAIDDRTGQARVMACLCSSSLCLGC
jgi:hypothetical protein